MDLDKPPYSLLNIFVQRISSSRPVSWFFARNLHRLDIFFIRLSGGRWTLTYVLAGLPVVILTTTGARSGLPRTMPLACIRDPVDPDRFAIIASNLGQPHHPGWYYNLKVHPRAVAVIGHTEKTYIAHEANGKEYTLFWQYALQIYPGYQLYQQRLGDRRIPIMVLEQES